MGNLKLYASTGNMNFFPWDCYQTNVWNASNNLMMNGDTIFGDNWYHELTVVPFPSDTKKFYLFSLSMLCQFGISYSVVDMSLNGGIGGVTIKNHQIATVTFVDGSLAIKHGNGRDWWYVVHEWQSNSFYICLITPNGVGPPTIINAGAIHNHNIANFFFNSVTSKLLVTNYWGLIEVFNFDRCTGSITLYQTVAPENLALQKKYAGSSISPSGQYMYVSNTDNIFGDSLRLDQYDLTAPNIAASKINIYTSQVPASGGMHALAPDGKIYMAGLYEEGFPYSDTTHNIYTDNLSVINYPDSPGVACNFQPWSFYLGGNRCYWGLPNNPDYDLGRDSGSVCDTLQWTGVTEEETTGRSEDMFFYPNPSDGLLTINQSLLMGKANVNFEVYDATGRKLISQPLVNVNTVNISSLPKGVYLFKLLENKNILLNSKLLIIK